MSTDAEWEEAGDVGAQAVRKALAGVAIEYARQRKDTELSIAMLFGSIVASAEILRALVKPEGHTTLEIGAIAYLRGAIRGLDEPITEDGRPYTGAFNG